MRYTIVDLEATCWEESPYDARMETIEIGVVELATASGPEVSEFNSFVRPVVVPELSEFCRRLTTIRQRHVDSAEGFWAVFPAFLEWIGPEPFRLCSWGGYDLSQFEADCRRHNLPFPETFRTHVNLKNEFARFRNVKSYGMGRALQHAGLQLSGTHHRGIDDARNIAMLAVRTLPAFEEFGAAWKD